jgi:hypothetical protein
VVPVVLLLGFAGCSFHPHASLFPPPVIQSAVAKSVCIVSLTWQYGGDAQKFQVQRTNLTDNSTASFDVPGSQLQFDDTGLLAATMYSYTVTAVANDASDSAPTPVTVTTPPFQPTFEQTITTDEGNWQGFTLVQRIEAARLTASGPQVRITLQASSASGASIDRIYISQASSAPGAHPYDSAADLTPIYAGPAPLVMAAGESRTVPASDQTGVNYTLDPTQPLLMAIDFTTGTPSAIRFIQPVPAVEATAFFFHYGQQPEAALPTRSPNYGTLARIYFYQKIEVG